MDAAEKLYMQSSLVLWVETFKANDGHPLEYRDLYDGIFLNDVMQHIDPRLAYDKVCRRVEDVTTRLLNWDILVKNIKGYYRDVLQLLLVVRPPNISAICREPGKDSSFAEIRKALLLILGCAVQCEQKEAFIDKIMSMDIAAQTEIVESIKEVTDDYEAVLPIHRPQSPTSSSSLMDKLFHHLNRLIRERDECAELATDLGQERDFYMSQTEGRTVLDTQQMSPDKHHQALELAECKAKLRHTRQELESRQEQMSDLRDELQESQTMCAQLKNQNAQLAQEARATRSLRDELDILREKVVKVDTYEKEILKYKEKLNELEFYKARTAEMKEENSILEETKVMLEEQLANSRKRIETVVELESELSRYRQQIEDLTMERDSDKEKIEYLTGENARLEFEKKSSVSESASLETELSAARAKIGNVGSSLSEQLSETSHARILRLELDNQRLAAKLAEMKEAALIQSAEVNLELEKENQRLVKKVDSLQSSLREATEQVIHFESELSASKENRDRLMKSLDGLQEKSDQQLQELERENVQLSEALQQIRERNEKTNDLKVKDLERENRRLHETVAAKNSQLSKLEFDTRQLQRSLHQLQESTHRIQELEQENQVLEKENADLHQKVSSLQLASDRLETVEKESSDFSVENRRLQKTVESFQNSAQKWEQLEQDHISLTVEHQRLQRMMESLKSESERALELEAEKNDLNKELEQVRKLLEGQKLQKIRLEKMEAEILDTGNENQRLQKSLDIMARQLQQLEKDNTDLETDKEQISKELETLKVSAKHFHEKDLEASLLEVEVTRLQKDKSALEKENRKLRQNLDVKDSNLEEINVKVTSLNQESRCLRQSLEKMKETCNKVKDLEKENKELLQELNTDRRTLSTLREELVTEKIRSQELSNELEQLTGELEKVGINTQKLTMAEQTKDANCYKALESMIEETLQKSTELKEKKIWALEARLEESKSRNLKLQEDLRAAKRESEVLQQRLEEEVAEKVVIDDKKEERERGFKPTSSGTTKELFLLKDHLVELERQNATLLAETDNLRSNNQNITDQCKKLETQLSNLQTQHATIQGLYSNLQERNAKLQVEYSTLQSQTSSAITQQDHLKSQLARLEAEHEKLAQKHEGLQNTHHSLVSDHESLQHLHEQLTAEYESLVSEHGSLKSLHKSVKVELKEVQDQFQVLLQGKDDVNKLRDVMEKERDQLKRELVSLGNLRADHQRLRDDHHHLRGAYDKLSQNYSDILASHKQVKTEYNNLQLKTTELQGDLTEAKENLSLTDMECQKLENKIEAVYQINDRIENENQALLMQVKQLLNQNHELLMKALNSKDHFVEEEKAYLEKLAELRRQKERLEEKIMEHYKNRISPKKKGLGARIARKARGIISRGPKRSKSRNNLAEPNDNSSQGSGSNEHTNEGPRTLGARSNEDISKSVDANDRHLPGLGCPVDYDGNKSNDGRAITPVSGRRMQGRLSPGSEMLTLNQFLQEANRSVSDDSCAEELKLAEPVRQQSNNDKEIRRNDHSITNHSQQHHHLLHPWQQRHAQNNLPSPWQGVPDVAASSIKSPANPEQSSMKMPATPEQSSLKMPATPEQSSMRMFHRPARSTSESSSFDSDGALPVDVVTSTPKTEHNVVSSPHFPQHSGYNGHVSSSRLGSGSEDPQPVMDESHNAAQKLPLGSDRRSITQKSSPFVSSRVAVLNQQSSAPGKPAFQASASVRHSMPSHHSLHHPYQQQQHSPSQQLMYHPASGYRSRELQAPAEFPAEIMHPDKLLTTISSADGHSPKLHYVQPTAQISGNADLSDPTWAKSNRANNNRDGDPGGISSPQYETKTTTEVSGSSSQIFQSQLKSSVSQAEQRVSSNNPHQNFNSSAEKSQDPRRLHALATTHNQKPQLRARPASAVGQSPHIRGIFSRPPGEGRPRQQQREPGQETKGFSGTNPGHLQAEQNTSIAGSHYSRPRAQERPKSVPPKLFNNIDEADGGSVKDVFAQFSQGDRHDRDTNNKGAVRQTSDVRHLRESQTFSNISLIREPSRSRSSSQFSSQSGESQDIRQPNQQQHSPNPQPEYSTNTGQPSISNNRQSSIGNLTPSHISTIKQEASNSSQNHPPVYHSTSWMLQQVDTKGQHPSTRPDFLPLTSHQEPRASRPEWRHMRQNHGIGEPSSLPRSQSSIGNPFRSTSSSDFSPGGQHPRNTAPSASFSPAAQHPRSNTPSSSFSPGAQHSRSNTVGPYPGRHKLDGHGTNNVNEELSTHQHLHSFGTGGASSGLSSNYHQDPSRTEREPQLHQRINEARNVLTSPQNESYPPTQSQIFNPRGPTYSRSSNPPPPPPRSSSQGPPQNRRSSGLIQSAYNSSEPIGSSPQMPQQQQQQQNTTQPQTRSHGKPPSSTYNHQNNTSAGQQLSSPGHLNSPGQMPSLTTSKPSSIPQAGPQSKTNPDIPAESEKDESGQQKPSTNSIWYEYGCV